MRQTQDFLQKNNISKQQVKNVLERFSGMGNFS